MPLGVKGQAGKPAYPYGPYGLVGVGREAICLLSLPLILMLAFVFPGIGVGPQGSADSKHVRTSILSFQPFRHVLQMSFQGYRN
jgi:hypothetical protein